MAQKRTATQLARLVARWRQSGQSRTRGLRAAAWRLTLELLVLVPEVVGYRPGADGRFDVCAGAGDVGGRIH